MVCPELIALVKIVAVVQATRPVLWSNFHSRGQLFGIIDLLDYCLENNELQDDAHDSASEVGFHQVVVMPHLCKRLEDYKHCAMTAMICPTTILVLALLLEVDQCQGELMRGPRICLFALKTLPEDD